LVALGLPFLSVRFENGDARTLPRSSEVRETALLLSERFPARGTDPVMVIADVDVDSPEFEAWFASANELDQVVGSSIHPGTPAGTIIVDLVPSGTSQGDAARDLVEQLRTERPVFATQVGGPAAELIDVKDILSSRLPWAALVVIVATLILLFLMTGSVIVPIKAVVMNILSLSASFGAMVWIFQDGNLSGLLRFEHLLAARTGHRRQPDRWPESMDHRDMQEPSTLVVFAAMLARNAVTRWIHQPCDVAMNEAGAFGVAERGARDLMHVQHCLRCERTTVVSAAAT